MVIFTRWQVVTSKVVANLKKAGAGAMAHIAMETMEEAASCIHKLHNSDYHGNKISIKKVSNTNSTTLNTMATRSLLKR